MSEANGGAPPATYASGPRSQRSLPGSPFRHVSIRHPSLRLLTASTLAGLLLIGGAGATSAHHPGFESDANASASVVTGYGLRPGDLVTDNGISVVVPERGHMIWGELKFDDGSYQMLAVETERNGSVRLLHRGDEGPAVDAQLTTMHALVGASSATSGMQAAQPDGSSGSKGECSDRAYSRYSFRMPQLSWRYASGTTPSKFHSRTNGTKQVINALKRANRNITDARNLCGRSDNVSATGTYLGTTTRAPNVSSNGTCTGGDGHSVMGWGSLPSNSIAMACVSGISGTGIAYEGDIRMNWNKAYEAKLKFCSGELLIEAAMTHEFGHLYGLGHVSTYSNANLTMAPRVNYCSMSHARLGLGDMLGLETKY